MELYMSGLFALGGTLLGIIGAAATQFIAQRNENIRHARKLAYDAGMHEWETQVSRVLKEAEKTGGYFYLSPPDDFILAHLSFLERVRKINPAEITIDDMASHIESDRRRSRELLRLRKAIEERLQEEQST